MKPGDSVTGEELIKIHSLAVLERKQWCLAKAAKTLGIDRKTLWRWLRDWGLIKGYYPKQKAAPAVPTTPPRPPTVLTPEQKLRHDPPTLL